MDGILREMPAASGGAGPAPSEVQSQGQARGTAETSPLTDVQVCVCLRLSAVRLKGL